MKTFLTVLGLIAVSVVAVIVVRGNHNDSGNTSTRPGPVRPMGVGALGRIEPCSEVLNVNAPSALEPAVVEELLVKVGDTVEAGQKLAMLDSYRRELADVELSRAGLRLAERSLERVLAGAKSGDIAAQEAMIERTRARVVLAEKQVARARRLLKENALAADELDTREAELEVQQKELHHHEAALVALREVRAVDVAYAEADVSRARAALQRAEADLEVAIIRSPVAGRVLRIHTQVGERLSSDGLLNLGDTSSMDVVAEVHESDILKVRKQQPVEITLRNLDRCLHGHVIEIGQEIGRKDVLSNDPVDDTDARVVEVRIRLVPDDGALVAGLSFAKVEVRIDTSGESSR